MRSHNRFKEEICVKERKNLSFVQRRERRSNRVYLGTDEEEIYLTVKVTSDYVSTFCRRMRKRE